MEPIADKIEVCSRGYIREATTAVGIVCSVLIILVTEIIRIILLKMIRPLLSIARFAFHICSFYILDILFHCINGVARAFMPCVRLISACCVESIVPVAAALKCINVDKRKGAAGDGGSSVMIGGGGMPPYSSTSVAGGAVGGVGGFVNPYDIVGHESVQLEMAGRAGQYGIGVHGGGQVPLGFGNDGVRM